MRLAAVQAVSAARATSSRAMICSLTFSARSIVASSCCRSSANSNRNLVAERRSSWSGLRRTLSVKSMSSRWIRSPIRWSTHRGDHVGESRSITRSMISSAFSDHWNARSASSWISASCRPSSSSEFSTRPIGGPHCGSAMRLTIIRSSTCWTSSSRSISTSTRSTVDASAATRSACDGLGEPLAHPAGDLRRRAAWSPPPRAT